MTDRERELLRYFREVRAAVEAAHRGEGSHPYRRGTYVVDAVAGDLELTLKDLSEEDAVLVASELRELGARVVLRGTVVCGSCGQRVPDQDHCVACRARLEPPPSPGGPGDPVDPR